MQKYSSKNAFLNKLRQIIGLQANKRVKQTV